MAWSPRLYATSRVELIEALTDVDDTVTDVSITIGGLDVVGSTVYVEWQATGRFSNPCLLRDDLLVEPTGRAVESAGVLIVRFTRTVPRRSAATTTISPSSSNSSRRRDAVDVLGGDRGLRRRLARCWAGDPVWRASSTALGP